MFSNQTIAAIATPPGNGGIGVVRLSGLEAHRVADAVFKARGGQKLTQMKGYTARLGDVFAADGARIDEVVALVYRAPKSYTGEDAVELMCHGGDAVCRAVLEALLTAGAAMAGPGEFTRRALLNGRMGLTEAEAVCDLINAGSFQGERAAAALQGGALARAAAGFKTEILRQQAHLAAYIDFPEEDVEELDAAALKETLTALEERMAALLDRYHTGALLLRGIPTVIAGSPNVGKSTLLNLLAGAPKALVTPVAGTTRDVVEQQVCLGGTTLLLADTAGIRDSGDEIERMGVERALERMEQASLILAVFDISRPLDENDRRVLALAAGRQALAIINKTDLERKLETDEIEACFPHAIYISANDPKAIAELDAAVARAVRLDYLNPDEPVLANERQRDCLKAAREAVAEAMGAAEMGALDAAAALLTEALEALARLTGEDVTETVLDEVFSRFCVGK